MSPSFNDNNNEGATISSTCVILSRKPVAMTEQKRRSDRGKRGKMRSISYSPLRNQLSLELSYCDSHSKNKSKRSRDQSPRKQFHLSLDKPSSSNKKLSRSTTQPNLKKSSTKPIRRTSTDLDLKICSHEQNVHWQLAPVKSTKPSIKKHKHSSHERGPSTDSQRVPAKSTKPSMKKQKQSSSHEREPSSIDWQRVSVASTKSSMKKHKHSSHYEREPSTDWQRVPAKSTKPISTKKQHQLSLDITSSSNMMTRKRTRPSRRASMGTSRAQTSPDESRGEPKRGVSRSASLDLDLSLIPESKQLSRASKPPKRSVSLSASHYQVSAQKGESKFRKAAESKAAKIMEKAEAPKEEETSPKMSSKRTKPSRRASMDTTFRAQTSPDESRREPKRGVTRSASLDFDLSLVPESKQPSRASKPPKRSVSLSASQVSAHTGESKLRKVAQKKQAESKATRTTEKVEAHKEHQPTKKTKPKKALQWSDRIRGKKAVDYSDVDPLKIWYSPQEILKLRETEKEVIQGLAVGYSRACRDPSLLNVEGLFSKKQQLAMARRRADYRKAVFVPPEGATAEQYEEFSRPASRSAQKRASRLSSHVFGLWNAKEDDNDSDTWSDVDEEVLENDDSPPPPPSLYSENCMAHRIRRRSSITNIISTSFSPPSSSHKSFKDGDGDEPTVWRSFKRRMSITPSQ